MNVELLIRLSEKEKSQERMPCSIVNRITVYLESLCVFIHGISS